MNYVFKLKNLSDLEIPGVVVNETITSRHDTDRSSEILLLLKNSNRRKFGPLYFRLMYGFVLGNHPCNVRSIEYKDNQRLF
jgi:hypothetical protein